MTLAGGNVSYITPNHGYIEYYQPANPAAGANFAWQPTGGWAYRFYNVWMTLANSAVVANRAFAEIGVVAGSSFTRWHRRRIGNCGTTRGCRPP